MIVAILTCFFIAVATFVVTVAVKTILTNLIPTLFIEFTYLIVFCLQQEPSDSWLLIDKWLASTTSLFSRVIPW